MDTAQLQAATHLLDHSQQLYTSIHQNSPLDQRLACIRSWNNAMREYLSTSTSETVAATQSANNAAEASRAIAVSADAIVSQNTTLSGHLTRPIVELTIWELLALPLERNYRAVVEMHAREHPEAEMEDQRAVFGPLGVDDLRRNVEGMRR